MIHQSAIRRFDVRSCTLKRLYCIILWRRHLGVYLDVQLTRLQTF